MRKKLIGIALLATAGVLLAAQGDDWVRTAIDQLRQEVAQLGLRVSRLEHAGGAPQAGDGSSSSSAATAVRTMVVDGITQSTHAEDNSDEINQLSRHVDALQDTVSSQEESVDQATGQGIQVQTHGQNVETDRGTVDRGISAQRQVAESYATQLAIKTQQLQQLQDANAQPRQIIHGHDGTMIITLDSKFNLSRSLESIDIGDTVTWTGTRLSADSGSESWRIDTIKKVN